MKSMKIVSLMVAGALSSVSNVAFADTETVDANAQVVEPVNFSVDAPLRFGIVVAGATPSSMRINPDNGRLCPAPLQCLGLDYNAAAFTVQGTPNTTVIVSHDGNVTMTGGGSSINARLFDSGHIVTLDGSGNGNFSIGGELFVDANQTIVNYGGQFQVSVNYQ